MQSDSAPGPDGFTGHFFKGCWSIVKRDLMNAIRGFFWGLQLPRSFSSTHLCLIPKVPYASSLNQLRPISLCNFVHKIISRILASRLSCWLPKVVSEEQVGFIPGRSIHENIALAFDLTNDINETVVGGNVIIKLDMSKAYDRISWNFIMAAMRGLGFSERACDLIFRCISNCHYSVKWDGKLFGFFKSTQGVRQGDPLSPSLFVLAMDWFSRSLNDRVERGEIRPFTTKRGMVSVNHLLFADDMMIFTNGGVESIGNLLRLIEEFCQLSGQRLNATKSNIIFSKDAAPHVKQNVLELTQFAEASFPIMYLGVPLFRGRIKNEYFMPLVQRIQDRIKGWTKKYISMGGRVTLINSVLNSVGIHSPIPNMILSRIASLLSSFLWDCGEAKRHHWIGWDRLTTPRDTGGLGIINPKDIQRSLHGKLAWKFLCRESLWARFAHARFREEERGSIIWNKLKTFLNPIRTDCCWHFGEGYTTVGEVCERLKWSCLEGVSNQRVSEIIHDNDAWRNIVNLWPTDVRERMLNLTLSAGKDRLFWTKAPDGVLTTKLYRATFQHTAPRQGWVDHVWNRSVPPKLACFVWRVINSGLPTDDKVARLGISLASKCSCCANPSQDSALHFFFEGEWGSRLWSGLSDIFDKPIVLNVEDMLKIWFDDARDGFMDHLGALTAAACLWELWKARNAFLHDEPVPDWFGLGLKWPSQVAFLIQRPYRPCLQHNLVLNLLKVRIPT